MKKAMITTSFDVGDKLAVRHRMDGPSTPAVHGFGNCGDQCKKGCHHNTNECNRGA